MSDKCTELDFEKITPELEHETETRFLSDLEILEVFNNIQGIFLFQEDNAKNMYDLFISQLNSRASRSTFCIAIVSLHRDYIGSRSNYRKWLTAIQDKDICEDESITPKHELQNSCKKYVTEVALYLMIWGEAANLRFLPEYLCFLFSCCLAYYNPEDKKPMTNGFLEHAIIPIYEYLQSQQYKVKNGMHIRRKRDHDRTVGYDDINLFFWCKDNLLTLEVESGKLYDLSPKHRYQSLQFVKWDGVFFKTYREVRSWSHLLTNFSRVWIIHLTAFWYFTSLNSYPVFTKEYSRDFDNSPPPHIIWSVVALGGALATLIALISCIMELTFVPRRFPFAQPVVGRIVILACILLLNVGPSVYLLGFVPFNVFSRSGQIIGVSQFIVSLGTASYLILVPPSKYFSWILSRSMMRCDRMPTTQFVAIDAQLVSLALWVVVFSFKFLESYFFLTLSMKDPIKELASLTMTRCHGDNILGNLTCRYQPQSILVLIIVTDLVLFFLDTYLWYVLCTSILSFILALKNGKSFFSKYKILFAELPKRIGAKILATDNTQDASLAVSNVWNAIIYSMYREHLISVDQAYNLMYNVSDSSVQSSNDIKDPAIFFSHNPNSEIFFAKGSEAQRRVSFFAQSLSMSMLAGGIPIEACPAFTVLIPHYSENILLSIEDIIKRSPHTQLTLLEYLKATLKTEWTNFVWNSRVIEKPTKLSIASPSLFNETKDLYRLPYEYYGFRTSDLEGTLRTRIWASLHSQTLYRTISGFMNYRQALAESYKAEHKYCIVNDHQESFESDLNSFLDSKFKLLVCCQKFTTFSESEKQDFDLMVLNFPALQVSIIEEHNVGEQMCYYSSLIDLTSKDKYNEYNMKYKIRLPGYPILGDGKADNQNMGIIYYRGEYIQVVDSNQDNYLEECMKIKSVLSEFEELDLTTDKEDQQTVAIVGAREYVFSEQTGAIGDITAGKEQTFGTVFGRSLAYLEAKLHYGHPDFVNGIFMSTRGGLSKAQRSLHLNEDIFAGMNAVARGGRIKHADYYQCGKGRDMGFNTVLNFISKIGTGMAEQILSREQFYFGTFLPTDRLLSFYYAHAGFHINNVLIMLSIHLFLIFLINIGSLKNECTVCEHSKSLKDTLSPTGCYDIKPVIEWIGRYVLSVTICFILSFTPLVIQEILERGILSTTKRICYHLLSLSPLFEVFVCQVYAKSFVDNRRYGGARYIATGRGYQIARSSFATLYARYAPISIYWGSRLTLLIIFACLTIWLKSLLWFWITCTSLCLSPFIFNAHQFNRVEFFLDYQSYLKWLTRGNHSRCHNTWVSFVRLQTIKMTGIKRRPVDEQEDLVQPISKFKNLLWLISKSIVNVTGYLMPYLFLSSQNGVEDPKPVNPLMRMGILSLLPILCNLVVLIVLFMVSAIMGLMFKPKRVADCIAAIAHAWSVMVHLFMIDIIWFVHSWDVPRTLAGICLLISIQRHLMQLFLGICISRESIRWETNSAWWTGRWWLTNLGWHILTQPLREVCLKLVELSLFAFDFILGHILLYTLGTFLLVPRIDAIHSLMLFWFVHPKQQAVKRKRKFSKQHQKRAVIIHCLLFLSILVGSLVIILGPYFLRDHWKRLIDLIPSIAAPLIQPSGQDQNDTGTRAPLTFFSTREPPSPYSTVW